MTPYQEMEGVEPLSEPEEARIAARAVSQGMTPEQWKAYYLRAALRTEEALNARVPLGGGMGRPSDPEMWA